MYVTLTIKNKKLNKKIDLQVDDNQIILEFIKIINNSLSLYENIENIKFIKSLSKERLISVYLTLKEANICTGEILEI